MKTAAFHELLESFRDAIAHLKGVHKTVARTDRVRIRRNQRALLVAYRAF